MLANALFVVLLFLVLYGLYRLWRSSLGSAGGPASAADWRRVLLQPHLEADAAPSDAHHRDDGRGDVDARSTRPQPLMETSTTAASDDTANRAASPNDATGAASGGPAGAHEARGIAPPAAERQPDDPPRDEGSSVASAPPRNAESADPRRASDPPSRERATTRERAPDDATTPTHPEAPPALPRAVASTRSESWAGSREPSASQSTPSKTTSAFAASSMADRPAPAFHEDEDDDDEALMEATVDLERFEALEREVETLREVNDRTLALERQLAELAASTSRADATTDRSSADAPSHGKTNAMPRLDAFTASVEELRDEIARSPLDPIARRRLMSELETYRLRGRHDDGLLTSVRHQLQRAQSEFRLDDEVTRPPPDEPRERVYPSVAGERAPDAPKAAASLFQAERPRDETERLRADLALRERQIGELRDALARERGDDGLASPFDRVPGRDDLKAIQGIGKRMERVLNELGVTTFAQLAAFEQRHIDRVAERLQDLPDDIEAENWVGQARELLARRRRERETARDG